MWGVSMAFREATDGETRLLRFLGNAAQPKLSPSWMDGLQVEDMSDGGMGSLSLYVRGSSSSDRAFKQCLSVCQFNDRDGVPVIASLYAEKYGNPFELDIWKVDFSPLSEIPENFELVDADRSAIDVAAARGSSS
jgi:hypothetical protein